MNRFFIQLTLPIKLLLLIVFPLALIVFLTVRIYREKSENAELLENYLDRINLSADISVLISSLQDERKFSYNYLLTKEADSRDSSRIQRQFTDQALKKVADKNDPALIQFQSYTFLDSLQSMRHRIDTGVSADLVMHFYTTAIFRLHTLGDVSAGNNKYLDPIFSDISAENSMSEMITYLEILNANFYNALYNRQNNILMLYGLIGVYDVYKSYEREFLVKAPVEFAARYISIVNTTELKAVNNYIDETFKKFSVDSSYSGHEWWQLSGAASNHLKKIRGDLLHRAQSGMNRIHTDELKNRDITLIFLLLAIILVFGIMLYVTRVITSMLMNINTGAQKIAAGETSAGIRNVSDDVIGSLAESILKIDKNHQALAHAADRIGQGDFTVPLQMRSQSDVLVSAVIRMRDNLKKLDEESRMLQERKDDFIKMASHELKTPVTTIKGYVQLLLTMHNNDKDPLLADSLATIERQVSKLTKLITDLLDLTRIETGKYDVHKKSFRLSEIITDLVKDTRTTSLTHAVVLNQHTDPIVLADKDRLIQVLSNLFSNAIKYSPGASKIIVEVKEKDNEAIVSVQDFGIGMSQKDTEKVFERFYRVPGKQEATFPGFGIGLYIVKEIITMHGGKVWAQSEKGRGTTFYFTLPLFNNQ
jgi:signal transduction histidine kinase